MSRIERERDLRGVCLSDVVLPRRAQRSIGVRLRLEREGFGLPDRAGDLPRLELSCPGARGAGDLLGLVETDSEASVADACVRCNSLSEVSELLEQYVSVVGTCSRDESSYALFEEGDIADDPVRGVVSGLPFSDIL